MFGSNQPHTATAKHSPIAVVDNPQFIRTGKQNSITIMN